MFSVAHIGANGLVENRTEPLIRTRLLVPAAKLFLIDFVDYVIIFCLLPDV